VQASLYDAASDTPHMALDAPYLGPPYRANRRGLGRSLTCTARRHKKSIKRLDRQAPYDPRQERDDGRAGASARRPRRGRRVVESEPGADNEHAERKERDPRQQELPEHPRFLILDLEDFKSFERTDRPWCVTHGSHYAPA
jgi:hypothetical protein